MNNFIVYIIGVIAGLAPGVVTIWAMIDNKKSKEIQEVNNNGIR